MKKLFFLLPVLFVMCQTPNSNNENTQIENDSLQRLVTQKDSAIYAFLGTFNEIENNLQTIKEKEHIIANIANNSESMKSREQKINDDINMIYDLMLDNKDKVNKLQKQLRRAHIRSNELQTTIRNLQGKLQEKDAEIIQLRKDLLNMNLKIDELSYQIDTLVFDNEVKTAIIEAQDESLNTAYYLIGTEKELKQQMVIDKKGSFIGGKKLNRDFNKSLFNKIDIREKNTLNLAAKKIKIITTHPSTAYTIYGEKPVDSLIIVNPENFWSVSKYLVVVVY